MSDYVRQKVIRCPVTGDDLNKWGVHHVSDLEGIYVFKNKWTEYGHHTDRFQSAPTEEDFLDYLIEEDDYSEGDWGKVRELYATEYAVFGAKFKEVMPWIDVHKLRVVEYCWYNCCEAPGYYEAKEDPFYKRLA